MPMKTKELQNEFSRLWVAKRRKDFFSDKMCVWCGSKEKLVLHHTDKSTKKASVIWSWSENNRAKEIEKCVVLCDICHKKHHKEERIIKVHGYGKYGSGCRCDICTRGMRDHMRLYRSKKKLDLAV